MSAKPTTDALGEVPPSSRSRGEGIPPSRGRGFPPQPKSRAERDRPLILMVDDSSICLEAAAMMLEDGGFDVLTVDSPFKLSSELDRQDPDLVLVDVGMPGLSGDKLVEMTRRTHAGGKRCPIVLYSDRSLRELRQLAEECGASGAIPKSADAATLLREVQRFLQG